jgi:hypothetical protein
MPLSGRGRSGFWAHRRPKLGRHWACCGSSWFRPPGWYHLRNGILRGRIRTAQRLRQVERVNAQGANHVLEAAVTGVVIGALAAIPALRAASPVTGSCRSSSSISSWFGLLAPSRTPVCLHSSPYRRPTVEDVGQLTAVCPEVVTLFHGPDASEKPHQACGKSPMLRGSGGLPSGFQTWASIRDGHR